jgi:hypothetical protein
MHGFSNNRSLLTFLLPLALALYNDDLTAFKIYGCQNERSAFFTLPPPPLSLPSLFEGSRESEKNTTRKAFLSLSELLAESYYVDILLQIFILLARFAIITKHFSLPCSVCLL